MSVVLSEYLPLLASAPDGIQKLRGLILELAVRGKLVPQDPNDEPASELLKRIAKERARLEAAGTCKKSKATPLAAGDAPPFQLPAGWALSQLSDLTLVLNGRAYAKDELLSEGIPVLRVGNLFTSNHWYYSNLQLEDDKYCDQGDLLYSWSASFGPFIWQGPKVIYHYHIWKLRLFDESSLSKEFFYKFLLEKTAEIKAAGHGVSMIHMTKEKMEKILVPVPPLKEQHRIVAKVDELMALCDRLEAEQTDAEAAHAKLVETLLGTLTQSTDAAELAANWQRLAEHFDTLFTTESSLDALKLTILQLAVMGKLVPQDSNDEPASESVTFARATAKLPKRSETFHDQDHGIPFDLPCRWTWVTVSDVAELRLGKMLDKQKNRGEPHPYLRNTNVHWFRFELASIKTMLFDPSELVEYQVQAGDVLICEGGHGIARSAVWEGQILGVKFQKALHRVRPLKCLNGHFLTYCLRVYDDVGLLQRYFTGAGIPHFTGKSLAQVAVPLPPLAEQHRIVAKVHELMALCDRLKADLAESRTRQARLSATLIESALQAA